MPLKKYLLTGLLATTFVMAAQQEQPTPYDLIRPIWPLTWDSAAFDKFIPDGFHKRAIPSNRTPGAYIPNEFIPDTVNQAYLDNINSHISPIRVNQAGYLTDDPERQFYYVGDAKTFEVVDINGKSFSPAITGTLTPLGQTVSTKWDITAGTDAATNKQSRYTVPVVGPSGELQKGNIPGSVPTETRLRIKVGSDISSTFIISDRVYSMVRSAALKFYGINRSGYGESWFHPASHTKDGAGPVVDGPKDVRNFYDASLAGTLQGGYYDCGDHLKEAATQIYAFMFAAVSAATNPDADEDNYAFNQSETINTDGIPDMLREAKHGADFVLRSFVRAKGVVDDMALSVGNFGSDHGWWGRPENSDNMPVDGSAAATDRGGPMSRTVRQGEIGANYGAEAVAGLAIMSKNYAMYDKPFADSCLMVAEKMYDFAKALAQGKSSYDGGKPFVHNIGPLAIQSPAYQGNNEYIDDMALAAVALWYATGKKQYADDAIRAKDLNPTTKQDFTHNGPAFFEGGWFVTENGAFLKNVKNTGWANSYAIATYALYKLILQDKEKALTTYGLTETEWLNAIEDCIAAMIANIGDLQFYNAENQSTFIFPTVPNIWKNSQVTYDGIWYTMLTDQNWIYNRYRAGDIFEVLAYADVANDIQQKNIVLPVMGTPDWKAAEAKQFGINQLNYLLGVNPWDVSFIIGVGDKNDAHPHHRAANPEGKNMPGASYKYKPPVGALYGAVPPASMAQMGDPTRLAWEDYEMSEVCIDAAATLVGSVSLASKKIDKTLPPEVAVEIRHVSMDSAIVMVKLSSRGYAQLAYGTSETTMNSIATADSNKASMQHEIILRGLEKGTTYYFYAVGKNAYAEDSITVKYMVDSTQTPFSFTTLNAVESADIKNVTICNVSADSAEIMWYTPNGEYESKIYWDTIPHATAAEYANNSGTGNADVSGIPTKFHYVKIGGLKERTTYYFMVESNDAQASVDDKGKALKFTTPVTQYDFSVRTYQYEWDGKPAINMNIFNNESRPFDSLTVRMYMRGDDDLYDDVAIRTDICQAYDEAGFNKACDKSTLEMLNEGFRHVRPVKIEDTYDANTGTWQWYFPIPLGSTVIKSSSRFRVDVLFVARIRAVGQDDPLDIPPQNKKFYCKSGNKWHWVTDITSKESLDENPGDWSWMPHNRANESDAVNFDGMPCEEKDAGDIDLNLAIENPYVSVYRKDEFVWGYSPSKKEMSQKRANYKIDVTLDKPFDVSNGSYVQIDQTSSTVMVTGSAHITEGGYISKIWANGNQIDAEIRELNGETYLLGRDLVTPGQNHIVAHYNNSPGNGPVDSTGLWSLNIPVKMGIGSNKVDLTIFAGPDPKCDNENGGCAFENRTYYVQFTRGNLTASALTIKDVQGNAISSPADPKNTSFYIYLNDKDKANYKGNLNVKVINGRKQDTLLVKMVEDATNPGSFKSSGLISAVSISKNTRTSSQISFFAGDTIQVIYLDPDDEEDISKQTFFAEATMPMPEKILAQDTDCDNVADRLLVQFTNALSATYSFDSIRVFIEGMTDTVTLAVDPTAATDQSDVLIDLPKALGIPENAAPMGKATLYMKAEGVVNSETFDIKDGIPPRLQSVTLLENPDHESDYDTLMISFTEPVQPFKYWPLLVYDASGASIGQETIQVIGNPTTENDGKSYMFVIAGNDHGKVLPVGATVMINGAAQITDNNFNVLDPKNYCKQVNIAETPKPVAVKFAEMRDLEGDGYPDELYMRFEKKLRNKDMLDSFIVVWGENAQTLSFVTKADTSSYIMPLDNSWSIKDSISAEYPIDTMGSTARDTFSIVVIKIPTTNGFKLGSTSGPSASPYFGLGQVTPRLGPEGGFFDKKYTVNDKCPPIVMSTIWSTFDIKGKQMDALEVIVSEPLDTIGQNTDYFERLRDGAAGTYYSPKTSAEVDAYMLTSKSYKLTYPHESASAFWLTDSIRLVPNAERAYFKDKAGLIAGAGTPWVPIVGRITKAKFKIDMVEPIATPNRDFIYGGMKLLPNENFRLSLKTKEGSTLVVASGAHKLQKVNSFPIKDYAHAGPVFRIEVIMPEVLDSTLLGDAKRSYEVSLAMDLFSNIGAYVNHAVYKFDPMEYAEYISAANSSLTFYLEWCAPEDYPLSAEGRKIATGPYIAKFTAKAKGKYVAAHPDESDNQKSYNANESLTKTFGFRRTKK